MRFPESLRPSSRRQYLVFEESSAPRHSARRVAVPKLDDTRSGDLQNGNRSFRRKLRVKHHRRVALGFCCKPTWSDAARRQQTWSDAARQQRNQDETNRRCELLETRQHLLPPSFKEVR